MNVCVMYLSPVVSKFFVGVHNLLMQFLELYEDKNFYYITFNNKKTIKRAGGIFNKFNIIDFSSLVNGGSWQKIYSEFERVHKEHNFSKIIVFYNHLILHKFGDESKIIADYNKTLERDDFCFKFVLLRNWYIRHLPIVHLIKKYNIPIDHYIYDPQEFSYKNIGFGNVIHIHRTFGYYKFLNHDNEFSSYVEYSLVYSKFKEFENVEKKYDFIFGGSIMTEDRKWLSEFFDVLKRNFERSDLKFLLFLKDRFKGIDDAIRKNEYDECVALSKFTLVIPSYEVAEFSMLRFLESISRRCVPLIHKKCGYKHALEIYPDLLEIIERRNLIIESADEIENKIKSNSYESVINEIINSNSFKKMTNLNWIKENLYV